MVPVRRPACFRRPSPVGRIAGEDPWTHDATNPPHRLFRVAAVLLLTAACSSAGSGEGDGGRLRIVTTVSPITDIVRTVAGEWADVAGLVPEGVNSHEFEPRPSDATVLARADLIVANGLHLETPTLELAGKVSKAPVVLLGDEVLAPADYVYDFSFPRSGGDPNPHLWTSPLMGRRYAEVVRDRLVALDPAHAETFRANYTALAARIDAMDRALRAASATVQVRKLLTYHDSFPYFAREYGWTVVGAIQPADFAEPSPAEVARLVAQVRRERVPAIFGSEVFPSPVLERIGREAGVRYVDTLRDDDLPGEPGDPGHSYLGLLKADFVTMVEALGGDASALKAL